MRGLLAVALEALPRAEMKGLAPVRELMGNFRGNEHTTDRITRGLALNQGLSRAPGSPAPAPHMPTPSPSLTRFGLPKQPGNPAQEPAQENEGGQNADRQD